MAVVFIALTLFLHPARAIAEPTIRIGVSSVVEVDPFVRHTLKELSEAMSDYPLVFEVMPPTQVLSASKKREFDFLIVGPQTMVLLDQLGLAHAIASERSSFSNKADHALALTIVKHRITPEADIARVGLIGPVDSVKSTLIKEVLSSKRTLAEKVQVNYFDSLKELIDSFKRGTVDAMALEPCTLEKNLTSLKNVIVIRETVTDIGQCSISQASYPKTQFAVLNGVPADLTDTVAATLKTIFYNGYSTWVPSVSLLPIRHLLEKHKVKEYLAVQPMSIQHLLDRFFYFIVTIVGVVLLFVIHSFLAEVRVRKQTNKLLEIQHAKEEAERDARDKQSKMESLERLNIVGQMSSMIAHELKQPLTSLENYLNALSLLVRKEPQDKLMMEYSISKMIESNRKAAEIIDHVRQYAKSAKSIRTVINVSTLAAKIFRDFEFRTKIEKKLLIQFRASIVPNIYVEADELELSLAIYNVLKNALDAVKSRENAQISLEVRSDGSNCMIVVSDNGESLSNEQKENLFNPLRSSKADGIGLGLAIVKRIMEAHAGRLEFNFGREGLSAILILPMCSQV
ncbi:ATP-binding protein [uncultured Parasutterella sp.]|nr:ATP-binding protein [uncultured Parasutterella sp.]